MIIADYAMCGCGHAWGVHLVPDGGDHRCCFAVGCACEQLTLVCIKCGEQREELVMGMWCDACVEAAGDEGLSVEFFHVTEWCK